MTTTTTIIGFLRLYLIAGSLILANTYFADSQEAMPTSAVSYIAVSAKLHAHWDRPSEATSKPTYTVTISGVTNMPKNSVLNIHVYDYCSRDSTIFDYGEIVTVGPIGEFNTCIT
jgi:hypothetical protein